MTTTLLVITAAPSGTTVEPTTNIASDGPTTMARTASLSTAPVDRRTTGTAKPFTTPVTLSTTKTDFLSRSTETGESALPLPTTCDAVETNLTTPISGAAIKIYYFNCLFLAIICVLMIIFT